MTSAPAPGRRRGESLEVLRAEAADERSVLIHERLRAGEDPWEFMEDLPTVDELVVFLLRADELNARGLGRPSAATNYTMLRQIALDYPPLTKAVWRLVGSDESYRRWSADLAADAS